MMDVYCLKCGEPYDVISVTDMTYRSDGGTRIQFYAGEGCPSCDWGKKAPNEPPFRSELMQAGLDILGDDVDGLAATLEDYDFLFGLE
jgi:hypothetical protein